MKIATSAGAPPSPTLLWFRQDLRLDDNPALQAALDRRAPVACVYIWAPDEEGAWPPGAASRWWLHESLKSLDAELRKRGSRLILARGDSLAVLTGIVAATKASAVYFNRRYEPTAAARDARVETALRKRGIDVQSFNASLFFEPGEILNKQGLPFKVFTQFWRACVARYRTSPLLRAPKSLPAPGKFPESLPLAKLELLPKIHWTATMEISWQPGAVAAMRQLKRFVAESAHAYGTGRNIPGIMGTSRLSPHLHFGEIGPRQIWSALESTDSHGPDGGPEKFLAEIGWREFAYHLLHHFPTTPAMPLYPAFASFPWRQDTKLLRAWQRGQTGFPIVDAGMRELWATGWMHNRVRMIAASFLTKDLLIPWQAGARWFWDTLVDADLASNTLGWQWVAGCGADAAPFFRIFNPTLQGERFDGNGAYVHRWVPELAKLPDAYIHQPSEAPAAMLRAAGIVLGKTYPRPIVDHAVARDEALAAYQLMKRPVRHTSR